MMMAQTSQPSGCIDLPGLVYTSQDPTISISKIAEITAPLLWFSPDEPDLYDLEGNIQLPQILPFDVPSTQPVVYYKVKKIYTDLKRLRLRNSSQFKSRSEIIDLSDISALEIEFYTYYEEETGLGGHPHDLESTLFQVQVLNQEDCLDLKHGLQIKRVIARAHGLYWFENALNVDANSIFPISILIEEGKHAMCTDKNADGQYTPGFDVTEKVNDAWGVRDIISTGKLFSGGFQGWMAKERSPISLLLPPNSSDKASIQKIQKRFPNIPLNQSYVLRPFPNLTEDYPDKDLRKMVKSKKPISWPVVKTSIGSNNNILRLSKENKLRNKFGFSYRFDSQQYISVSAPLLLVRHVEAPMTGGWFYNKFYIGDGDSSPSELSTLFGHQIQHTNSASRWLDSYIGIGYERVDINRELGAVDMRTLLVTEIGMKIRVNITKTPLKFFKFLGTDYWGIRFGWKNLGFSPFSYNGIVLEIGAGAF